MNPDDYQDREYLPPSSLREPPAPDPAPPLAYLVGVLAVGAGVVGAAWSVTAGYGLLLLIGVIVFFILAMVDQGSL